MFFRAKNLQSAQCGFPSKYASKAGIRLTVQLLLKSAEMIMNKPLGIALLVIGVVLIVFGISASESFGSDLSRFFTGTPTNKSIWLLIGGIASAIVGLFFSLGRASKS